MAEQQKYGIIRQSGVMIRWPRPFPPDSPTAGARMQETTEIPQKVEVGPALTVNSECCLTGAPNQLLAAIRSQLTIVNPKYQAAKRYSRWVGKQLQPKLYFYREEPGALIFPRGFGNRAVRLCRDLTGASPVINDQRQRLDEIETDFHGHLRPYQQVAVEAILRHSFGVLEAGTGSGKTVIALKVIAARRQPAIILVHSKELLYQWRERIVQFMNLEAGQAGDGRIEIRPITVAIVNTARKHLDSLPKHFGHVVVDECHRVPASLFTDVVSSFASQFMLGLSATAFRREDGMTDLIYTYMGDCVHRVDGRELAASGAVVRPELIQRQTGFTYGFRGEYARLLKALARNEERNEQIAVDIVSLVSKGHRGTILVVSDRVAHCEALARHLAAHSIESVVLTGQVPGEQRARIVQDVRDGQVRVLIATVQLIGEGFDCPGLATLVLATPIKFEGRLLQVVGRIMRPGEGKRARVIDYVDVRIPVLRRSGAVRSEVFERW